METNSTVHEFTEWLTKTQKLAESTSKSYYSSIKSAENYHPSKVDLFAPNAETLTVITEIFNDPTFMEDNKYRHNTMSSALKHYAEFLTSSQRQKLFEKNKQDSEKTVKTADPIKRGGVQMKEEPETFSQEILPILLEQFAKIEKEQREIVLASYDIEDQEESIRSEQVASSNIRKIKQWKTDISKIFQEMSQAGFSFEWKDSGLKNVSRPPLPEEKMNASVPFVEPPVPVESKEISPPTDTTSIGVPSPLLPRSKSVKPLKFAVFGETYSVSHWNELLVFFCEIMLKHKPEIIATFDKVPEFQTRSRINFSYKKEDIVYTPKQLSNGMWIETNRSAQNIKEICYKILNLCGYDESELVFFVEGAESKLPDTEVKKSEESKNTKSQVEKTMQAPSESKIPSVDTPEVEEPKVATPPLDSPVVEEPKLTTPPMDPPVVEESKVAAPPTDTPVVEEPKVTAPPLDIPIVQEPKVITPSEVMPDIGTLNSPATFETRPQKTLGDSSNISEMRLLGHNYMMDTPIEFFLKVCELMVLHRPYAVGMFHENKTLNWENHINFSYHESDMNNHGIRLNNGLWVNKNQEESKIVTLCYDVIKACGLRENNLIFTLKGG